MYSTSLKTDASGNYLDLQRILLRNTILYNNPTGGGLGQTGKYRFTINKVLTHEKALFYFKICTYLVAIEFKPQTQGGGLRKRRDLNLEFF